MTMYGESKQTYAALAMFYGFCYWVIFLSRESSDEEEKGLIGSQHLYYGNSLVSKLTAATEQLVWPPPRPHATTQPRNVLHYRLQSSNDILYKAHMICATYLHLSLYLYMCQTGPPPVVTRLFATFLCCRARYDTHHPIHNERNS
jgi:hypothetical protein